ncbi:MAG TPA: glycine/sarcosine/betaine reductase component B subunit, partial [Blastocatellia bacterium]
MLISEDYPVELELLDYALEEIEWGDQTRLKGKFLSLCLTDLQAQIQELSHGIHIDYQLARPNESKRIAHVLDTVLPITKSTGSSSTFPGFDRPAQLVGTGQTIRLKNLLVTVAGRFPHPELMTPIERPREGIIDMAGVGASYSYGSDHFHLVLSLTPDPVVSNAAFDIALRSIALRCARFLAQVEKTDNDPKTRIVALNPVDERLPKVVLIYQVQSQLVCARTFYYGEEMSRTLPTLVHPAEFFDGAVVSGNYKSERKIPTSLHCANPFIEELLQRHGKTVNF